MDYLVGRGNEDIPIERIATDLKIDKKIVASIASRLVSRGAIARTSRGVYVHKQLSVKSSTVEAILAMLQKTVTKTFGKQIAEKVDISVIKDGRSIEGLEEAVVRLRKILGVAGANNIFRLVVKRVAKPSEGKYILMRLDVPS
jgi:hypothetical protein